MHQKLVLYTSLTIIPSLALLTQASILQSPSELSLNTTYDYIIVGAGAGGSVLANRLSEDTTERILLIEAGSSDYTNIDIRVPSLEYKLLNSRFDWNFTTANQSGLNGRSISYPRGHVLGGSTSINQMVYSRGSRDDFDRWANVTRDPGWSWTHLIP